MRRKIKNQISRIENEVKAITNMIKTYIDFKEGLSDEYCKEISFERVTGHGVASFLRARKFKKDKR